MQTLTPPTREQLLKIVHAAHRAPSGHNTQPWKFRLGADVISIYPDFSRRLPVVDPDDHALCISIGAALENLVQAAGQEGFEPEVTCFPDDDAGACVRVRLRPGNRSGDDRLADAIETRQSTRNSYDGRPIPTDQLRQIEQIAGQDGVHLRVFTGPKELEEVIEFVKEGNRQQFSDPAFMQELLAWIRFSRREVAQRQDGLTAGVMGLPAVPRWFGKVMMKLLTGPKAEANRAEKRIRGSSGLLLFIAEENDKRHWINLGRRV